MITADEIVTAPKTPIFPLPPRPKSVENPMAKTKRPPRIPKEKPDKKKGREHWHGSSALMAGKEFGLDWKKIAEGLNPRSEGVE
jgi:hypothetical protein